tara:strand:+ start:219 stop:446 length:228 start_codon:yes stop_codon:yes gene_type:complete
MISNIENIKKGTELVTKQLGFPTRAIAMESIKQGRGLKKTLLVDVKAAEWGLFDEIGSVYVTDIIEVLESDDERV